MLTTADQLSNATKASIDSQLAAMSDLANKALHSVAELAELNIATARATLEHASSTAQQLLAAKDAQEVIQLSSSQAQPSAEKALAYGRHLAGIATKAQVELTKATEERMSETSRQFNQLLNDLSQAAPAGSEQAIALVKTSVANASAACEQLLKASKNAIQTAEESFNEAAKHFVPATDKPARNKKSQ
ncbi:MAG: family phasin [Pseudomonadota bacterium]|jgi:phasin family protein